MSRSLENIRVINLSHVLAAPTCTMFLADEWLPDGLQLDESVRFARSLETADIARPVLLREQRSFESMERPPNTT
ncbi:MAG: hypothetical protein ABIJ52_17260 [Pseudomonadota bacterium]